MTEAPKTVAPEIKEPVVTPAHTPEHKQDTVAPAQPTPTTAAKT